MAKNHEPKPTPMVEPKTYTQEEAAAEYAAFVIRTGWQIGAVIQVQELTIGGQSGMLNIPIPVWMQAKKQEPQK